MTLCLTIVAAFLSFGIDSSALDDAGQRAADAACRVADEVVVEQLDMPLLGLAENSVPISIDEPDTAVAAPDAAGEPAPAVTDEDDISPDTAADQDFDAWENAHAEALALLLELTVQGAIPVEEEKFEEVIDWEAIVAAEALAPHADAADDETAASPEEDAAPVPPQDEPILDFFPIF